MAGQVMTVAGVRPPDRPWPESRQEGWARQGTGEAAQKTEGSTQRDGESCARPRSSSDGPQNSRRSSRTLPRGRPRPAQSWMRKTCRQQARTWTLIVYAADSCFLFLMWRTCSCGWPSSCCGPSLIFPLFPCQRPRWLCVGCRHDPVCGPVCGMGCDQAAVALGTEEGRQRL